MYLLNDISLPISSSLFFKRDQVLGFPDKPSSALKFYLKFLDMQKYQITIQISLLNGNSKRKALKYFTTP